MSLPLGVDVLKRQLQVSSITQL